MKIKGTILLVLTILAVSSCAPQIDAEAEKAAIIKVINAETEAYLDYDYNMVTSYFVHDSLNFRLSAGADNLDFLSGWAEIDSFFKSDLLGSEKGTPSDTRINVTKDDYRIKLYENSAYVLCTEKWTYTTADDVLEIDSRQVRFMEKIEGEWKIAFLSFIGTSGYEEELEELDMEFNSVR